MDGHLGHSTLADNNFDTSLSHIFNVIFKSLFFTFSIVFQLLGVSEKDCSLCFTLVHFNICVKNGNFSISNVMDSSFRLSQANHTSNNFRIIDTTSQYFLYSDIVNV